MSQHEGVNHQAHMPAYQRHGGGAPPHPPHEQHGQYQPAAAHHLGAAIPSGPVYECDGIQFKMLDELVDVKVKRLRSEKIKPIEELTFDDIKAYNRNQLRVRFFIASPRCARRPAPPRRSRARRPAPPRLPRASRDRSGACVRAPCAHGSDGARGALRARCGGAREPTRFWDPKICDMRGTERPMLTMRLFPPFRPTQAYCFVYGIKRKKKAEMEGNMARYAAMFHPNDPAFEITSFVPTDYVEGPIPRRRVPVTKEQKAQSAGKFAARFLPTQRARAPASMPQPAYSGVDPSNPSHSSGAYSSGAPPAHHLQPHHASQQQPNHQPPHQQQPPHHQPHHQQQPHHQHHQQHQHQQQHYRGGQSTAQQQQPHPNNYNLSSYHMVAHNLPLEMGEE
jgi:hypothetical protein